MIIKRTRSILKSKLLSKGYGVTKIAETYIENYDTSKVKEDSCFVVNNRPIKVTEKKGVVYNIRSGKDELISIPLNTGLVMNPLKVITRTDLSEIGQYR